MSPEDQERDRIAFALDALIAILAVEIASEERAAEVQAAAADLRSHFEGAIDPIAPCWTYARAS